MNNTIKKIKKMKKNNFRREIKRMIKRKKREDLVIEIRKI
jgi:hypothetical protein